MFMPNTSCSRISALNSTSRQYSRVTQLFCGLAKRTEITGVCPKQNMCIPGNPNRVRNTVHAHVIFLRVIISGLTAIGRNQSYLRLGSDERHRTGLGSILVRFQPIVNDIGFCHPGFLLYFYLVVACFIESF